MSVNINTETSNVVVNNSDRTIIVNDNTRSTSINVNQPITNVISVNVPGPQGPVGPLNTGSFVQGGNSFGATGILGTNDNQSLGIETNGLIRMFISSSGNIGIGKTTPNARLDISGSATISGSLIVTGNINTLSIGRGNGNVATNISIGTTPAFNLSTITGNNIALGIEALFNNNRGTRNLALGHYALRQNSGPVDNIAIGFEALYSNNGTSRNIAIGNYALRNHNPLLFGTNIAIGHEALFTNTSGYSNIAIGERALYANTTGYSNFALASLGNNTTGYANVSIAGMNFNTTGYYNTAIGGGALQNNTTGDSNTVLGYNTGQGIETGRANTIIGANVTGLTSSLSNTIILADGDGNQKFIIDSSSLATLSGSLNVTGVITGTFSGSFQAAAPTGSIQFNSDGAVSGSSLLVYDTSLGRVNIGTPMPITDNGIRLNVGHNRNGSSGIFVSNINTGSSAGAQLLMYNDAGFAAQWYAGSSNSVYGNNTLFLRQIANGEFRFVTDVASQTFYFGNDLYGGNPYARIGTSSSFSGNVGVGMTGPASRLHVRGAGATSSTTALRVENSNASASLVVRDNGNVGIGTATPNATLNVSTNNNDSTLSVRISNDNAGGRAGLTFNLPNNTNESYSIGVDNDRFFKISNGVNLTTNTRIAISPTGNVGIGKTTPNATLDILGNAIITGSAQITGSLGVTGSGTILNPVSNTTGLNILSPQNSAGSLVLSTIGTPGINNGAYLILRHADGTFPNPTFTGTGRIISTQDSQYFNGTSYITSTKIVDISEGQKIFGVTPSFGGTLTYYGKLSNGNWYFGDLSSTIGTARDTSVSARVQIKGAGATSSTTALRIENSNSQETLQVRDDGVLKNYITGSSYPALETYVEGIGSGIKLSRQTDGFAGRIFWNSTYTFPDNGGNLVVGSSTSGMTHANGLVNLRTTQPQLTMMSNTNGGKGFYEIAPTASNSYELWLHDNFNQQNRRLTLGFANNGDLSYYQSGSVNNLFFVSQSGNVGIGTISPTYRLDISGSIRSAGGSNNGLVLFDGTYGAKTWMNTYIYTIEKEGANGPTVYLFKYNDGSTALNLNSTSIIGLAGSDDAVMMSRNVYAPHNAAFGFTTYGSTTKYKAIQAVYTDNNTSGVALNYKTGGTDTEGLRLTSAGNIGIGTTTPTGRNGFGGGRLLEIVDNTNYASLNINGGSVPTYLTLGAQNSGADIRSSNLIRFITSGSVETMRMTTTGLVGIGTTSPTARLQVQGSGATSSTTAFSIQNSTTSDMFRVRDDSTVIFGGANTGIFCSTDKGQSINLGAGGLFLGYFATGDLGYSGVPSVTIGRPNNRLLNATTGTQIMGSVVGNYSPTTGTGLFTSFEIVPTINQTGGANGITRGLYVNPTLTSAADFRAIETTAGNILFQSGSTPLLFVSGSGRVGIGTISPSEQLHVSGNILIGNYPASDSQLRFANVSNVGNSAYIGRTAAGFEINPGSVGTFRLQIPPGSDTAVLSLWGNGVSTAQFFRNQRIRFGGNLATNPSSTLEIIGEGATSSTTAFRVQNSNATASIVALDNGFVGIGKSPSFPIDVALTNGGNSNSALYASNIHPDGRCILYGRANTNVEQLLYWWHSGGIGIGTGGGPRGGAVSYVGDRSFYGPGHDMYFMETATTFGPTNVKYRLGIATTTTNTSFASGVANNLTNIESNTFTYTARSHTFFTGTTTGSQALPNQFTPLHLSNSGSVGIGTTAPNARLDVSGSAIISGSLTVTQTITGSIFIPVSGTFVLPLTSSVGPNIPTGSAYWSGSFLFIWDGSQYRSSSFS